MQSNPVLGIVTAGPEILLSRLWTPNGCTSKRQTGPKADGQQLRLVATKDLLSGALSPVRQLDIAVLAQPYRPRVARRGTCTRHANVV